MTATVTVTKNDDNTLSAAVKYEGGTGTDKNIFENVYKEPKPAEFELEANKSLVTPEGTPAAFGDKVFEFEVQAIDGAPEPERLTATTGKGQQANKTVSFGKITFDADTGIAEGTEVTYKYVISEKEGTNPSVQYDTKAVTVTVTVSKNGDNELIPTVKYEKGGQTVTSADFVNVYDAPEPTEEELSVTKNFATDEGEPFDFGGNVFRFKIEPQEGAPEPEKLEIETTGSDVSTEELSFGIIEFTEDVGLEEGSYKDYVYEITEIEGDNPSVTYDPKTVIATVRVTKVEGNKLDAKVTYTVDGEIVEKAEFDNTYTLPQMTTERLKVDKSFAEPDGTPMNFGDNVFSFTLTPATGSPGSAQTITTTEKEASLQELYFDWIEFTEDVGLTADSYKEYKYTITEGEGNNPSVGYDGKEVTATIRITKTKDNTLTASVKYEKDGQEITSAEFANTYNVPKPAELELTADKRFITPDGQPFDFGGNIFEFEVEALNGAPVPEQTTATTSKQDRADETVSFGKITFNEDTGIAAGTSKTYEYIVREKEGANPSVEYDGREVKVTVTVTKNEQNELEAVATYEEAGEPEPTEKELFVTKNFATDEGEPFDFGGNVFKFKIEPQNGAPEPEKLEIETTGSDVSTEELSFGKIKFTEDVGLTAGSSKDYVYKITEIAGDNPSVTYDPKTVR